MCMSVDFRPGETCSPEWGSECVLHCSARVTPHPGGSSCYPGLLDEEIHIAKFSEKSAKEHLEQSKREKVERRMIGLEMNHLGAQACPRTHGE